MYYLAKDKEDELLKCGFEEYSNEYEWSECYKNSDGDDIGEIGIAIDKKTKILKVFANGKCINDLNLAEEKIDELYNKGLVCVKKMYLDKTIFKKGK